MKTPFVAVALVAALATASFAQTTPAPAPAPGSAPTSPATGAATPPAVNGAPLENGANSFTEDQAKSRLEQAGITGVTGLTKDDNGVWRGRGTWQGRSVAVGIDFRGNISAQ